MKIAIIGAGGFGREVLAMIKAINSINHTFEILGFVDDNIPKGTPIHEFEIIGKVNDIEELDVDGVVVAIGNSQIREEVVRLLPTDVKTPNIIHPAVQFLDEGRINMGTGNIICAGNIFTTDINIGDFCVVNLSCTIGHDAVLGDFTSIMPGVNISGGARLNKGVYVGTGAKLIKATTLGEFCKVGAGAVVDMDVSPYTTVVGIPAKPLRK